METSYTEQALERETRWSGAFMEDHPFLTWLLGAVGFLLAVLAFNVLVGGFEVRDTGPSDYGPSYDTCSDYGRQVSC